MSESDFLKLVEDAEFSTRSILDALKAMRTANEELTSQLQACQRKNRALQLALDQVKLAREKDRATIAGWRSHMESSNLDSPRATSPPLRSQEQDPVLTSQGARSDATDPGEGYVPVLTQSPLKRTGTDQWPDLLSQRVLPMSIGVSDLEEEAVKGEVIAHPRAFLVSSPPDGGSPWHEPTGPTAKRRALVSPSKELDLTPRFSCTNRYQWLQGLIKKTWHPSEFKYNAHGDAVHTDQPFTCESGGCDVCATSLELLEELGMIAAESQNQDDILEQETPVGFWRVDHPGSSQVRAEQQENLNMVSFEGRQRLASTLWRKRYIFRDAQLRRDEEIYMK